VQCVEVMKCGNDGGPVSTLAELNRRRPRWSLPDEEPGAAPRNAKVRQIYQPQVRSLRTQPTASSRFDMEATWGPARP
jgi:hypothetical protein